MFGKKKGKWIRISHIFRADEYECSECGEVVRKPTACCPCCETEMKIKTDAGWVDELEAISAIADEDW